MTMPPDGIYWNRSNNLHRRCLHLGCMSQATWMRELIVNGRQINFSVFCVDHVPPAVLVEMELTK